MGVGEGCAVGNWGLYLILVRRRGVYSRFIKIDRLIYALDCIIFYDFFGNKIYSLRIIFILDGRGMSEVMWPA
jgi:hypothetical protein